MVKPVSGSFWKPEVYYAQMGAVPPVKPVEATRETPSEPQPRDGHQALLIQMQFSDALSRVHQEGERIRTANAMDQQAQNLEAVRLAIAVSLVAEDAVAQADVIAEIKQIYDKAPYILRSPLQQEIIGKIPDEALRERMMPHAGRSVLDVVQATGGELQAQISRHVEQSERIRSEITNRTRQRGGYLDR